MVLVTAVDLDNSILLALLRHTQILPPRYVITLNVKENWISYVCMYVWEFSELDGKRICLFRYVYLSYINTIIGNRYIMPDNGTSS